jgi:hypothetical protein
MEEIYQVRYLTHLGFMPTLKSLLVRDDEDEVMEQEIGVSSPRSKS